MHVCISVNVQYMRKSWDHLQELILPSKLAQGTIFQILNDRLND